MRVVEIQQEGKKDEKLNTTRNSSRLPAFLLNSLRSRTVSRVVAASFAIATAGCGRASADPARFSGRYGTGRIEPAAMREARNMPHGHVALGPVTARCRADEGVRAMRDTWLADVDCSEDLLAAALRERASAVGGDLLVGRGCTHDEQSRGELWKSTLVTCWATVAAGPGAQPTTTPVDSNGRPLAGADFVRPAPPEPTYRDVGFVREPPAPLEYGSPTEAFRVKVGFVPARSAHQYASRQPGRVNELAVLPPSHVVMGDIAARCRGECDRAAVRYAVRAAAARVGATDVVGIVCIAAKHGFLCTGRTARPEADPETNFLAR